MHQILPAAIRYSADLAAGINSKREATNGEVKAVVETSLTQRISSRCDSLYENTEKLYANMKNVPGNSKEAADYYSDVIIPGMDAVRKDADFLEKLTAKSYWPYPLYSDLLFY